MKYEKYGGGMYRHWANVSATSRYSNVSPPWRRLRRVMLMVTAAVFPLSTIPASPAAATNSSHVVYSDALTSGWANWSWSSTINFAATKAYSGTRSISWRIDAPWAGMYLHSSQALAPSDTAALQFALHASGTDQRVSISLYGEDGRPLGPSLPLSQLGGNPPAGMWKSYDIPLSALGVAGTKITGISLQDGKGSSQPPILVDQVVVVGMLPSGGALAPFEVRPENKVANNTRGRATDPTQFRGDESFRPYYDKINGDYVGTTEDILGWAAKKWGFDKLGYADLAKAQAVKETWWKQAAVGIHGELGILQVYPRYWPDASPAGWSTAYSADYAMAVIRYHYDGNSWLGQATKANIRHSVAAWECGCGSNGSGSYATAVWGYLDSKPWLRPNEPPDWF